MSNSKTETEQTTRDGEPAVLITCTCASHPEGEASAIAVGRTSFPADRIHGFVLMAHHPTPKMRAWLAKDSKIFAA